MTVNKESIFDSFDKFNEIIESYGVGFDKSFEDMVWFNYRFFLGVYNIAWLEVVYKKDAFHKELNFNGGVRELFEVVKNLTFIPESGRGEILGKTSMEIETIGCLILLLDQHFEFFYNLAKEDRVMRESLLRIVVGCNEEELYKLPPHLLKFSFEMAAGKFPLTKKQRLMKKKNHRDSLFYILISSLEKYLGVHPTANSESRGKTTGCDLVTEWFSKKFEDGIEVLKGRAVVDAWEKCEWRNNIDESAYVLHLNFLSGFLLLDYVEINVQANLNGEDFKANFTDNEFERVLDIVSKELNTLKQKDDLMNKFMSMISKGSEVYES